MELMSGEDALKCCHGRMIGAVRTIKTTLPSSNGLRARPTRTHGANQARGLSLVMPQPEDRGVQAFLHPAVQRSRSARFHAICGRYLLCHEGFNPCGRVGFCRF